MKVGTLQSYRLKMKTLVDIGGLKVEEDAGVVTIHFGVDKTIQLPTGNLFVLKKVIDKAVQELMRQ